MKKIYLINNSQFGIDFENVICFYIDGEIDTYRGKWYRWLNILVGTKFGQPDKIKFVIEDYSNDLIGKLVRGRKSDVEKLYNDLIEYFK